MSKKKFEIVINPFEEFSVCNSCLKYGLAEASIPRTVALMVAITDDKGNKFPPFNYCFDCAESDFIGDIRRQILEARNKSVLGRYKDLSKVRE